MQERSLARLPIVVTGPNGEALDAATVERLESDLRSRLRAAGVIKVDREGGTPAPKGARSPLEFLTAVLTLVVACLQIRQEIRRMAVETAGLVDQAKLDGRPVRVTIAGIDITSDNATEKIIAAVLDSPSEVYPASARRALIIVNAKYKDPHLPDLDAPEHDANALRRVLGHRDIGDFDVDVIEDGSQRIIEERIADFFAEAMPDDFLLVHYSGHGLKDRNDQSLHLAANDSKLRNLTAVIPAVAVLHYMRRSSAGRVVLILDCCHSGAFDRGTSLTLDRTGRPAGRGSESGRFVLTASDGDELAYESDAYQPSIFTGALVEGLIASDVDVRKPNQITVRELFEYAAKKTREIQPGQTPRMWAFGETGHVTIAKRPTTRRAASARQKGISSGSLPPVDLPPPISPRPTGPEPDLTPEAVVTAEPANPPEPVVTAHAVAEPATPEPLITTPAGRVTAEPLITAPATAERDTPEPFTATPAPAVHSITEGDAAEPGVGAYAAKHATAEAVTTPAATERRTADGDSAEGGKAERGTIDGGLAESRAAEGGVAAPVITTPVTAERDSGESTDPAPVTTKRGADEPVSRAVADRRSTAEPSANAPAGADGDTATPVTGKSAASGRSSTAGASTSSGSSTTSSSTTGSSTTGSSSAKSSSARRATGSGAAAPVTDSPAASGQPAPAKPAANSVASVIIPPARRLRRMRNRKAITAAVAVLLVLTTGYLIVKQTWLSPVEEPNRHLVIGVDLPFRGSSKDQAEATLNAMQLYLDSIGGKAGLFTVALKRYDNAIEVTGQWDEALCLKNAEKHVATTDEVAVMGTYNSGCAKAQMPILNADASGPMLMVSHANTSVGLTKASDVAEEPQRFAPSGKRSYARVIPPVDMQGVAAAELARDVKVDKELKTEKCLVLNDGTPYGKGTAAGFAAAAKSYGMETLSATWSAGDTSFLPLFDEAKAAGVACVYFGGSFTPNAAQLIKDKVQALGDNALVRAFAPDEFRSEALWRQAEARNIYLTHTGIAATQVWSASTAAKSLLEAYKLKHKSQPPTADAFYGVVALQVILAAIESSDGTRRGVRDRVFEDGGFRLAADRTLMGHELRINPATGDVARCDISVSQVSGGKELFLRTVQLTP